MIIAFVSCYSGKAQISNTEMVTQGELSNTKLKDYSFLECMYSDSYFPKHLVDKCKNILL